MPEFKDYEEYAAEDALVLPIRGKKYRIEPLGIKEGILLERIKAGDTKVLDDMSEQDVLRLSLGAAYDEMVADNVPRGAVGRAHMTAMAFHEGGEAMALAVWDRSIDPKLEAALAAVAKGKTTTSTTRRSTTSTAAASSTKPRASTSGTSSRKGTRRAAPTKKNRT